MNEQYIERYWRDATPEDAINEPPMVARFRYEDAEDWEYDLLVGWDRTDKCHWRSELDAFEQCQVYDAPDPGDGWRLIDPHKEPLREGDEFMFCLERQRGWIQIDSVPTNWAEENFYRRRIEPPKPKYEPFRWEDREQLRGRWIAYDDGNFEVYPTSFFLAESTFFVGTLDAQKLVDHWRFLDTGEPVGRKVQ